MATVRSRGKFFYARWREKDGSSAEKGGFVTQKEAKQYGEEQEALIRWQKHEAFNLKPDCLSVRHRGLAKDVGCPRPDQDGL